MNELVTKKLLKAFGDKSKQIFKLSTKTATSEGHIYSYITTDLDWDSEWSISLDVVGKGVVDNSNMYTGDIKFFCNVNNSTWKGNGYCLEDNDVVGVFFQYEQGKVALGIEFSDLVGEIAVDIINYSGQDTSNVLITGIELCDYKGDWGIYNSYVLGRFHQTVGSIGEIIRLRQQSTLEQFVIVLPDSNDPDTVGVARNVPVDTTYIESVNDSKWSKYLKSEYELKLKEGDLKASTLKFGGSNNLEFEQDPLEINNSVQGYTNYQEGDWVGKVKVNSKGLVTAVEKDPELPKATETTLGVVQVGYKENLIDKQYPVKLDADGNAYVHVPWNDTDTWNKVADSNNLGLIKIGYAENGKNYPVKLDSENNAYVNVPWVSSEYNIATKDTAGLIKIGYSSSNTINLPIKLDSSGKAYAAKQQDIFAAHAEKIQLSNLNSYDYCYILPPIDGTGQDHFSSSYLQSNWREPLLDTFTITIDAISQQQGYSSTKTIRFENPYEDHQITIIVTKDDSVRVCNMFSADIMNEGVKLLPKQTIELVFTYWHYNNVTFNGGFSV